MSKLSKTQQQILATAAARPDGAILPLPDHVTLRGAALTKTLASLVKRGLATERGKSKKPAITKAGRAAVGANGVQAAPNGAARGGRRASDTDVRPDSKQNRLLALLRRPEGAAITVLTSATGWQPHSVRAALTGFRKRRISVTRSKDEAGITVYRVPEDRRYGGGQTGYRGFGRHGGARAAGGVATAPSN